MEHIITKADGTTEAFDPTKLISSLERAGADPSAAQAIAQDVERSMRNGATTHEIYAHAFEQLRQHRQVAAARYSLKRAVLQFGPSGFPFESYLAELYRTEGYQASVDVHVQGKCVEHEVDVVLTKGEENAYLEAKFHNTPGFKTDLQVALYVQARTEDIIASHSSGGKKIRGILATNTKFTSLALSYATCKGLELLGWEYPHTNNLHDRIEAARLYPITALTTLSNGQKTALLTQRVVLCRDLTRHEDALAKAGVSSKGMNDVLMEAGGLCDVPA